MKSFAKLDINDKPKEPTCVCKYPNKLVHEQAAESKNSEALKEVVNETSANDEFVDE